jgi:hypothetical protein
MKEILLKKFNNIPFLDFNTVIENLKHLETINQRLNYLLEIKLKYFDEFERVRAALTKTELDYYYYHETEKIILENIFANHHLKTTLVIQEPVYDLFFKDEEDNPEYTYWFLQFDAQQMFNVKIKNKNFVDELSSPLKEKFIQDKLNTIEKEKEQALELTGNEMRDEFYRTKISRSFDSKIKQREVLRVLYDYYKNNSTSHSSGWITVTEAYCDHVILRPFLESKLERNIIKPIELTVTQVALILIYEGKTFSRSEATNIAKEYGHLSGNNLFNTFCEYHTRTFRKARPDTKLKLKNRINLIESILEFLDHKGRTKASDEIIILKSYLTTY